MRAVVPHDLELVAALHRRPGVAGDDGDAAERLELRRDRRRVDPDHPDDARHLQGVRVIDALHLAAEDRRARDDGVQHPLGARVDPVDRLAGRDVAVVDEPDHLVGSDVAERRRVLQLQRLARRDRQRRGGGGERAVAERALRRRVHDGVVRSLHFRDRHAPLLGGSLLEHRAGGGAGAAQGHEEVAQRARAVGILVAVARFVARRLRDADLRPVGIELVGDDHRDRGAHALSHLLPVAGHGDDAVGGDGDEDARVVAPALRHAVGAELLLLRAGPAGQPDREHERAGGDAAEERAPADVREHEAVVRHGRAPFAACLMAARMRG